jgi:pimeloyl-ACP methyl ester carboxylesterase
MATFTAPDGTTIFYTDEGTGTPILALAGLTRNSEDFRYVAPHLADHRLIRMDYRGRGRSDWADPSTYTIPVEGQDAVSLLDHLGIEKTAILGTSRGGIIAMGLAATVKDRLTGVCLNDIGPELMTDGLKNIRDYMGRNPAAKTYSEAVSVRSSLLPGFNNVSEERWQEEVRIHYRQTPDGLVITYDPKLADAVEASAALSPPDLWPYFDALEGLPLALIRGANSNLLSSDTAAKMQVRRPDIIFEDVADRGHVPFLDEPEALDVIKKWKAMLP